MQLSYKHAQEKKKCIEEVTSEFFGKFTAISHISIVVGTVFMSIVFESVGIKKNDDATVIADIELVTSNDALFFRNASELVATTEFTQSTTHGAIATCGLFYKFANTKVEEGKGVDDTVMYILLSTYLACNLLAATLCLCLDEVRGTETEAAQEAVCASMISLNSNKLSVAAHNINQSPDEEYLNNHNHQKNQPEEKSAFKLLKSTLLVMATDKAAWLLIPFTLHYGMIQGFARGTYNASWIACALGMIPINK